MITVWLLAVNIGHGMSYIPVEHPTKEACVIAAADYEAKYVGGAFSSKARLVECHGVLKVKTK